MPKLEIRISHNLPEEEALKRIKTLFSDLKVKYKGMISNVNEEWKGNINVFSLKVKGIDASGVLTIKTTYVEVRMELHWVANLIKGKIERMIRQKVEEILS